MVPTKAPPSLRGARGRSAAPLSAPAVAGRRISAIRATLAAYVPASSTIAQPEPTVATGIFVGRGAEDGRPVAGERHECVRLLKRVRRNRLGDEAGCRRRVECRRRAARAELGEHDQLPDLRRGRRRSAGPITSWIAQFAESEPIRTSLRGSRSPKTPPASNAAICASVRAREDQPEIGLRARRSRTAKASATGATRCRREGDGAAGEEEAELTLAQSGAAFRGYASVWHL